MAEELKLTNEQRLMQRLSPLQAQYVSLVEMNRAEIEEKVRNEIDDNPALEVKDSSDNDLPLAADNRDEDGDTFNESAEQMQLADYRDEDDIPYYRTNISNSSPDDEPRDAVVVAESSIIDFLNDQIAERDLSPRQQAIAKYIIGNIDDNGYLQRSIEEICDDLVFQVGMDVSDNDVKEVLQMVHDLEPAGIAAADLRECLLLQLERRTAEPASLLAYQIIDRHFDEFSKKHFARIMSALNADETLFREAIDCIRSLNPKPGSAISGSSGETHSQQIIPDFTVEIDGDTLILTLVNDIPELQIEESFSRMYSETPSKSENRKQAEAAAFVRQKYEAASNFIRILRQRQETLYSTMAAIVKIQNDFFFTGDENELKPMRLKDIQDITGRDLSIISRATTNKYVSTQWGIFPLKFFFIDSRTRGDGDELSSRELLAMLKQIIDEEDKKKPLNDEQLCAILKERGYEVARRTVAKYREKLEIPIARLRREP